MTDMTLNDRFVKRYSSAIEATPTKWLTEPLPSAPTKNPVATRENVRLMTMKNRICYYRSSTRR